MCLRCIIIEIKRNYCRGKEMEEDILTTTRDVAIMFSILDPRATRTLQHQIKYDVFYPTEVEYLII